MKNEVYFNVALDTTGVELKDGTKAVLLSFIDKDTGIIHHFPIPADTAGDIGNEITRISKELGA